MIRFAEMCVLLRSISIRTTLRIIIIIGHHKTSRLAEKCRESPGDSTGNDGSEKSLHNSSGLFLHHPILYTHFFLQATSLCV